MGIGGTQESIWIFLSPLYRHLSPCWRNPRLLRISVPQEHLELVDLKRGNPIPGVLGPPTESPRRKPLHHEPETLCIVKKQPYRCPPPVRENKHRPAHGIGSELFAAKPCEAVNAAAEIGRLDGKKDLHAGSYLNHRSALKKALVRVATSTAPAL